MHNAECFQTWNSETESFFLIDQMHLGQILMTTKIVKISSFCDERESGQEFQKTQLCPPLLTI